MNGSKTVLRPIEKEGDQLFAPKSPRSGLNWNDDGGPGLASQIEFTAPSSKAFFLRLTAFALTQTGPYSISIFPGTVDNHGNHASIATKISIPSNAKGSTETSRVAALDAAGKSADMPIHTLPGTKLRNRCPISWWNIDMPPTDWTSETQESLRGGSGATSSSRLRRSRQWCRPITSLTSTSTTSC